MQFALVVFAYTISDDSVVFASHAKMLLQVLQKLCRPSVKGDRPKSNSFGTLPVACVIKLTKIRWSIRKNWHQHLSLSGAQEKKEQETNCLKNESQMTRKQKKLLIFFLSWARWIYFSIVTVPEVKKQTNLSEATESNFAVATGAMKRASITNSAQFNPK